MARTLAEDAGAGRAVVGGDGEAAGFIDNAKGLDGVVIGARLGARAPRKHLGDPEFDTDMSIQDVYLHCCPRIVATLHTDLIAASSCSTPHDKGIAALQHEGRRQ